MERVPAHVNQARKTVDNSLLLYYSAGSTFSTDSHKRTPENCGRYPKVLNGEALVIIWIFSSWDCYTKNLNTDVMFFHTEVEMS